MSKIVDLSTRRNYSPEAQDAIDAKIRKDMDNLDERRNSVLIISIFTFVMLALYFL